MEKQKKTESLLRNFKRKTKKIVKKDLFTEFFFINKNRKIIEFLSLNETLLIESFFKQLIPKEFSPFTSLKILNEFEEEVTTWYFEEEIISLVIFVNWGFKKQEISIDLDIEPFIIKLINDNENLVEDIDYNILNNYIIGFITNQAENLSKCFSKLNKVS
jgi:hypothetical protein